MRKLLVDSYDITLPGLDIPTPTERLKVYGRSRREKLIFVQAPTRDTSINERGRQAAGEFLALD